LKLNRHQLRNLEPGRSATSRSSTGRGSHTDARLEVSLALGKQLVNVLALELAKQKRDALLIDLTSGGRQDRGDVGGIGLLSSEEAERVGSQVLHFL
jgi:hypothetical protein